MAELVSGKHLFKNMPFKMGHFFVWKQLQAGQLQMAVQ